MPEVDFRAVLRMLASVGAKLLLLAFITPFVIMMATVVFALAASQAGDAAGWIAIVVFFALAGYVLNRWLKVVRREFP